jgi:hypothetical protein
MCQQDNSVDCLKGITRLCAVGKIEKLKLNPGFSSSKNNIYIQAREQGPSGFVMLLQSQQSTDT